jgi:ribonuclease inhibitor
VRDGRVEPVVESGQPAADRAGAAQPVAAGVQGDKLVGLGQMLVEIDGRQVRTEDDLHRLLARHLDFGPYYGSNLDALWDRLTRDVPRPVGVIWTHWRVSKRNLGAKRFRLICDLLRAVEAEDQELGRKERFAFELRRPLRPERDALADWPADWSPAPAEAVR